MNLSKELTGQINDHLAEVRKYLGALPADERQEILQSIESHIYDALENRSDGVPSSALLDAVIAEMDSPESYGEIPPTKQHRSITKPLLSVAVAVAVTAILGIRMAFGSNNEITPTTKPKHPPVVISTFPQNGNNAVDPNITELRVTFNKDMLNDRMWSWCIESPDTAPKFVSSATRFIDKRTCVTPVELEPNKTYVVWINTQKHDSFRDIYNNPAIPYRLEFRTSHAQSNPEQLSSAELIGRWVSIDFVESIERFEPEAKSWHGDLSLKELTFLPEGKTDRLFWTWKDGILHHSGDNTDAKLLIKTILEEEYLFMEWISGDVIHRGKSPKYYVLKKADQGVL